MLNPDLGFTRAGRFEHLDRLAWAADNGCFSKGERFDPAAWGLWLEELGRHHRETCIFAVAPDVVGNAQLTMARYHDYLGIINAAGLPAAFVIQDGQEAEGVPWDDCAAVFMGGTTAFKLSEAAYTIVREARDRGKWRHMGRVNTSRRMMAAHAGLYDSADGTFLRFGPDENLPRLCRWLDQVNAQTVMGAL